jgi:hypothetical protein
MTTATTSVPYLLLNGNDDGSEDGFQQAFPYFHTLRSSASTGSACRARAVAGGSRSCAGSKVRKGRFDPFDPLGAKVRVRRCLPPHRKSFDRTHSGRSSLAAGTAHVRGRARPTPAARGPRSPYIVAPIGDLRSRKRHPCTKLLFAHHNEPVGAINPSPPNQFTPTPELITPVVGAQKT